MSKLISTYARTIGLKIDVPNIKEQFYPHPFDRYITVQTGSGQAAKCYDYWQEVIILLKPILDANKIAILHLGAKEDSPLMGVQDLRGKTNILQSNYLIGKTLAHMGNDSWLAHCAGWHYKPLVALYGSTSSWNHGPYWSDVEKTVLIDAHRWGGKPTYTSNENPKTINTIPPEQVANSILKLLGIGENHFAYHTRFIGLLYAATVFDLIPNTYPNAGFCPEAPINVRMDHLHNEVVLSSLLQTGRKVNILTKNPININLLNQHRVQILSYNHELGVEGMPNATLQYVDTIKAVCPHHSFFTRETDARKLNDLRCFYFDHIDVIQIKDTNRDDYLNAALAYMNWKPDEKKVDLEAELSQNGSRSPAPMRFKTNKFILSDGKVFISYSHMAADKSIGHLGENVGDVIDSPEFFRDLNHYMITHQL